MVHTDVRAKDLNPLTFMTSVPRMLHDEKCSNSVALKRVYPCPLAICHCVKERKLVCEFECPDEETVRTALIKIGLPATAILAKPN
jgi:hypothetical protein